MQTREPTRNRGVRLFDNGARQLLEGAITSFYLRAKEDPSFKWELRDVSNAVENESDFRAIIGQHKETKYKFEGFLKRQQNDVFLTTQSFFNPLSIIAALWHGRPKVSLYEWKDTQNPNVLILGSKSSAEGPMKLLNRLFFEGFIQVVLDAPEKTEPDTYILFDEFSNFPKIEGFDRLITEARTKGISDIIAFQNIAAIEATYRKEISDKMLSEIGTKILLRGEYPYSEWGSRIIGKQEIEEYSTGTGNSETHGKNPSTGMSENRGVTIRERDAVSRGDFESIPPSTPETGCGGYFLSTIINGVWHHRIPGEEFSFLKERGGEVDFIERHSYDQILKPWTDEERERLGLKKQQAPGKTQEPEANVKPNLPDGKLEWRF